MQSPNPLPSPSSDRCHQPGRLCLATATKDIAHPSFCPVHHVGKFCCPRFPCPGQSDHVHLYGPPCPSGVRSFRAPGTWDLSATLTTDGLTGEVLSSSDIVSGSLTLSGPYGTFTEAISNISGLTADSTGLWAINTQPWPAYIATPDMVVFWSSTSYYDVPPSYSGRVSPPLTASQVGFGTVSPDWPVQDGEGIWLVATVSEVPEPASIMLLVTALLGLVGFTFVRRRRRAKGYRQLNWMGLSVALIVLASGTAVRADTITHGGTTVNMDFVSVGNAGNPADTTGFGAVGYDYRIGTYDDRGREGRLGSRPPLPPNRTGGSPASGSPVSGFTSKRIDGPRPGRGQAPLSASAGIVDPDLRGKAINMTHRRRDQSVPGHVCLMQSVVLSRCRHLRYGGCLVRVMLHPLSYVPLLGGHCPASSLV